MKKYYFASDFHLGIPDFQSSLEREKKIVSWLDEIKKDAEEIFLLGDIFDFWFDYKTVVPKGYTRLLGKLSELCDNGIKVHYFIGNHDMWVRNYFEKEIGLIIHRLPFDTTLHGKRFYLAHGDGLGPSDHKYKFLKKCFANPFLQWCFANIHPGISIRMALYWSRKSRASQLARGEKFHGEEEWLVIHSREQLKNEHYDYFIYGHRHIAMTYKLNENSTYINLGDWITLFNYGVFDGNNFELRPFCL